MKVLTTCIAAVIPFFVGICREAPAGVFARPRALARSLPDTYAAICESYYGMGNYSRLLVAELDKRQDGTPNIVLNRDKGQAEFTIRLSVNEAAYGKWRDDTVQKMKMLGLSTRMSDFEHVHKLRIAGMYYYLGDNEMAALSRRQDIPTKPVGTVVIRVTLVGSGNENVRQFAIPLDEFSRVGYDSYPLPLHKLNRLRDLPVKQFRWFDSKKEDPQMNATLEDAYAKFTLDGLTDKVLNSIKEMKCEVLQTWQVSSN